MKKLTGRGTSLLSLALLTSLQAYAREDQIPYPHDYRQWLHVKSMIIQPGHPLEHPFQGLHHIYANKEAQKGLESGVFANGAMLVFDLLNYRTKNHAVHEDERKLIGIMYKDTQRYKNTGGWGFEGFSGNSTTDRLVSDGGESCFSCHASKKNNDYVFSKIRP